MAEASQAIDALKMCVFDLHTVCEQIRAKTDDCASTTEDIEELLDSIDDNVYDLRKIQDDLIIRFS